LSHWRNGEVKVGELKGKVVVLDFWATYCVPCIASFPKNNEIDAKHKPRGFVFLGICTDTMQDRYDKIVADKGPKYPMARDAEMKTMKAWGVESFPNYAVVDRKGIVRAAGLKHEYIEKVVEKLLDEPAARD
jgi:thiol-disulfide isomerase/thioredoxin